MTTAAELQEENRQRRVDTEKLAQRINGNRCAYCGCFEAFGHSPKCHFYLEWAQGQKNEMMRETLDSLARRDNIKPPLQIVTPIPPEVEQYATEIARFVETMVYKLGVHSKKGKWENLDMRTAISKLNGEVMELEEAIGRGNMIEQMLEAADVANYALIISAKAMERK